MDYPLHLLPSLGATHIEGDLDGFYLLRKSKVNIEIDPSTGVVKDGCIHENDTKQYLEWSCNLFANYNLNHLGLVIINKSYNEYWDYETEVSPPLVNVDFEIAPMCDYYFLPIDRLAKIQIPYSKDSKDYHAKAHVYHCPTRCNFWHFELRWKDNNGDFISKSKSKAKWVRQIRSTIKAFIKQYITLEAVAHIYQ